MVLTINAPQEVL